MLKTARSVITQIRCNAFQAEDYENMDLLDELIANPPGFIEGFVVNLDYPPAEYGQVFENLKWKLSTGQRM